MTSSLTPSEKSLTFFTKFKQNKYKPEEKILTPGDTPAGVYYLKTGFVRQFTHSSKGIELTLHIFKPGSFFPLTWGVNAEPIQHYFESLTDTEIYIAPKDEAINFIQQNPDILYDLSSRLLYGLSGLINRIEYLALTDAYTRTAAAIVFLAKHFGTNNNDAVLIKEKFTHKNIANIASLARETCSREIEKLQNKGLISYQDHYIVINSIKNLENEVKLKTSS